MSIEKEIGEEEFEKAIRSIAEENMNKEKEVFFSKQIKIAIVIAICLPLIIGNVETSSIFSNIFPVIINVVLFVSIIHLLMNTDLKKVINIIYLILLIVLFLGVSLYNLIPDQYGL